MKMSEGEVRYQLMRPGQIVARRERCPIAYIPTGTLEWHGPHNPVGADTLQAETMAVRCAQRGGGLAFPALYYGECRVESLVEANSEDRELIADYMKLDAANFDAEKMPFSATEQVQSYNCLLQHILAEVQSLGFKLGVIVAGHYPLVDHARAAVIIHNKRRYNKYHGMLGWAFCDYLLIDEDYPEAGDHAGGWETSHLLASHWESVDLGELGPKGEKIIGVSGQMQPQDATAEFGEKIYDKAVEIAVKEAHHRLENPDIYKQHGWCLKEGLWKRS
jgi:creatinine amidohydrolase